MFAPRRYLEGLASGNASRKPRPAYNLGRPASVLGADSGGRAQLAPGRQKLDFPTDRVSDSCSA